MSGVALLAGLIALYAALARRLDRWSMSSRRAGAPGESRPGTPFRVGARVWVVEPHTLASDEEQESPRTRSSLLLLAQSGSVRRALVGYRASSWAVATA